MRMILRIISLCTAVFLGFVWVTTPALAQGPEKVQAEPAKKPGTVG